MITTKTLDIEQLQKENEELCQTIDEQGQRIKYLEEQLAWLTRQIFGRRSEKIISNLDAEQLQFEGFASLSKEEAQTQSVPAHQRSKPKHTGQDTIQLPSDLPVETIVLDIPEEEKVCTKTGVALVKIGEVTSYKLAHRPGSYYLKAFVRPKYAHPQKEEAGIFTASMPDGIIPKCRADESLLAEIAVKKFADHMPLYRIAEQFNRENIFISRKLLSQWVIRLGNALQPLYEVMKRVIIESGNIFIDESPVKIQDKPQCKHGYMWTIVGGEGVDPPYRIYDFKENRRHENVRDILGDYKGALHSDNYAAYGIFAKENGCVRMPCWTHIRRKFFEAGAGDLELREWALAQIQKLFQLEEQAWLLSPEERLKIRQEQAVPIIDAMIERIKRRLIEGIVLPKSKFKEALGYFCSLIPHLKNYTLYPYARIDNNVAERAIRPLAIGRKNWLFFGSAESGRSAAVLLSLVQTCRGLHVNPRDYLEDIFRKLMGYNAQKLEELLPDRWLNARKKSL